MTTHAFRLVNVFAESPLAGNPLCVFEDGRGLDDATMQALALQFNLSETTFVLPSSQASARVRIFTPTFEMPFAGHPTLGTAHVVRAVAGGGDRVTLEMQAGVIPVDAQGDVWTLQANAPTHRRPAASRAELAAMLGLREEDVLADPLWVDTGSEQLLIPLASVEAVDRAAPDAALMRRHGSNATRAMAYVFAQDGSAADRRMRARFFFPKHGAWSRIPAPARRAPTSAAGCSPPARHCRCGSTCSRATQVGRPCRLGLEVTSDRRIRVSGRVVEIARGVVELG